MGRKLIKGGDYRPGMTVTREAKDLLADWLSKNYNPKQELVVSQLITVFVTGRESLQQYLLGKIPPEMKGSYAKFFREIADELERDEGTGATPLPSVPSTPLPPRRK